MHIVIEGGDGTGKSGNAKALAEKLKYELICFPDRRTPIGKLIDLHLKQHWSAEWDAGRPEVQAADDALVVSLDPLMFQGLQIANRVEVLPHLLRVRNHLVCDRYWQSGCAYGGADGLDKKWLVEVHRAFPPADLNILLIVPPEVAIQRVAERRGKAVERYEAKLGFTKQLQENYIELWGAAEKHGLAGRWVVVDTNRSKEVVQKELLHFFQEANRSWGNQ